jgi:hypothetical protein
VAGINKVDACRYIQIMSLPHNKTELTELKNHDFSTSIAIWFVIIKKWEKKILFQQCMQNSSGLIAKRGEYKKRSVPQQKKYALACSYELSCAAAQSLLLYEVFLACSSPQPCSTVFL